MFLKGIQNDSLNQIHPDAGKKPTNGVATETALSAVCGSKYKIRLDHQVLTDHGVFYPCTLWHHLAFELTLSPASSVLKGSGAAKLVYKPKNIRLE